MLSKITLWLFLTTFHFAMLANGQYSLTNPLICHDKDNNLKCYNDGDYLLSFANGNLKKFKTIDNSISYGELDKTITFLHKINGNPKVDTIQIQLLPKSILLKKGASSLEITSLKNIPGEISAFYIGTYSINNVVSGLGFWHDEKYVEIEVWDMWKTWSWNILLKDKDKGVLIDYNGYKKNRVEHIFVQDNNLKYGVSISMTFKSLKKINRLESYYIDSAGNITNVSNTGEAFPVEKRYGYYYDKKGKLKTGKGTWELKLCDCN